MEDGCIFDIMTADDYVAKVFVPERLPSVMSAKSFLMIALDLELPNLREKLVSTLLKQASLVPRAIAHARYVNFSVSAFTFIMKGNLTSGVTGEDTQRLINAAMPILRDRFPTMTRKDRKQVLHNSPHLIYCIKKVVNKIKTMKGGTRHLILFVCVTAVVLADRLGVLKGTNLTSPQSIGQPTCLDI